MNEYEIITKQLLDVIQKFNRYDSKECNFGTDFALHLSEIHMLAYIKDNPDCSVTDASKGLDITKGAVSQLIKKLSNKGYVSKIIDPANKSRNFLQLTDKGITAAILHEQYHNKLNEQVAQIVKIYSDSEKFILLDFLKKIANEWK